MNKPILHINHPDQAETLRSIEDAIAVIHENDGEMTPETVFDVLETIRTAAAHGEQFIVPIEIPPSAAEIFPSDGVRFGETFEVPEDISLKIRPMRLKNGAFVYAAFTGTTEVTKGEDTSTITQNIETYLEKALMNPDIDGIMLNPWGLSFFLTKPLIKIIFERSLPCEGENTVHIGTADITRAEVECIVSVGNNRLPDGGVDSAVHCGAEQQLPASLNDCETDEAKITKGCHLNADFMIHTVGPVYSGTEDDARMLRRCYWNCLELARKNEIRSIAFPSISIGAAGYPPEEATEIALNTVADWLEINPGCGMAVVFACDDDAMAELYHRVWDHLQKNRKDRSVPRENNGMLEQALSFAMECHKGAVRKGTDRPYILHPIETLQILSSMNADIHLMIAGLLHDTLEDTDASLLDIYERFGADVAALVNAHTEDKRKIWYMRKLQTIHELPGADIRHKMLVLADKVANLRNMYADYKRIGDELWRRFHAPKQLQAWYYSKVNDGLYELQNDADTEDVYWEMVALYKDLFVIFAVDEEKGLLYQLGADGDNHVLKKGSPQWNVLEEKVSGKAKALPRKDAERMEDNWSEPFWKRHDRDRTDADYDLFLSEDRCLSLQIREGKVTFVGQDFGEACASVNGKDEYEFRYRLDEENSHRLLVQLRLKHGLQKELRTVLKDEFGGDDGSVKFKEFCNEIGVDCWFSSY